MLWKLFSYSVKSQFIGRVGEKNYRRILMFEFVYTWCQIFFHGYGTNYKNVDTSMT